MNSAAKTLNQQEKRNAKFSGEFKQFTLSQAADRVSFWRENNIFSANDIARMLEIQFISDLVMNIMRGLSDFGSARLNKIYSEFEEDFPDRSRLAKTLDKIFRRLASIDPRTLKDTIFSRQPIFFSLCYILADLDSSISKRRIERALIEIDEIFNADIPISEHSEQNA